MKDPHLIEVIRDSVKKDWEWLLGRELDEQEESQLDSMSRAVAEEVEKYQHNDTA